MKQYPSGVKDASGRTDSVQPVAVVGYYGEDGDVGHRPFPVDFRPGASGVEPLEGEANASTVVGPFVALAGRPVWIALSGVWSGSVTVQRSTDDGDTKHNLTAGGEAWGAFTGNACEPVTDESEDGATYFLNIVITSGTVAYRVSQ